MTSWPDDIRLTILSADPKRVSTPMWEYDSNPLLEAPDKFIHRVGRLGFRQWPFGQWT